MLQYNKTLKERSRALRNEMTDAEQLLWSRLRRKQLLGIQFYRQKPIGPYVVDFYAPAVKLVIEADGSQHFEKEHAEYDVVRDAALQELELLVLRFNNRQILTELTSVMQEIFRICSERQIPLNPPFSKGDFEIP
jgi:very-short-patch-repair endonuclease